MKSTLKVFVTEIAALFDKDLDFAFKKQIESSIIGFRATLLRQEFEKYGRIPATSMDSLCFKLIRVPAVECCLNDEIECVVARTDIRVPNPIRLTRFPEPFSYVGTSNKEKAFTFVNTEEVPIILKGTKFINKALMYSYYNDYIYTFNFEGGKIAVRSAFANQTELLELNDCGGNPCIEDIFFEEDMKKTIRQMVIEDFRAVGKLPQLDELKLNDTQS
jgi:hypothetical protein